MAAAEHAKEMQDSCGNMGVLPRSNTVELTMNVLASRAPLALLMIILNSMMEGISCRIAMLV
jgi:hypothetical protein